jgi:predicted  nucleic acid-binding Zn-ribbon protein
MSKQLQSRLATLNSRIDDLTADITALQAETGGSTEVISALTTQIERLTYNNNTLLTRRTSLQAQIDSLESAWSTEEQAVVDAIDKLFDSEYHDTIENDLKSSGNERRSQFFTLYAGATTDFQRRWVIKYFFNL